MVFGRCLLIPLITLACAKELPQAPLEILTLERTVCYGWCPSYKITVTGDGRVTYEGRKFVKNVGRRGKVLDPGSLQRLADEFRRLGYFNLRDHYASSEDGCPTVWTDNPSVITSVRVRGTTKTVEHYLGCQYEIDSRRGPYPEDLTAFENQIDEIVGTKQWIGTEQERAKTAARR